MDAVRQPVGWDGHLALLHGSERQRRDGVAAWVRRGLDLDAKILYIEPADEAADRSLLSVLRDRGIEVDRVVRRGQLHVLPASDQAYSPGWQADVVEEALADGYPTVRWSGEADTAWRVMTPSAHAEIEGATDNLCRTQPVSILCQYSADLSPMTLQSVCAVHAAGVRDSLFAARPVPGGIAMAGEVDASNARLLRSAVRAASSAAGPDGLVVDLAGLAFLDVAGVRALMTGTSAFRRGGTVRLREARPPVATVLHLLDVDRAKGMRVE